ncbi:MAG: T9SS type A sorting domain-containing protein [Bacteroidota bacterium]|nr:T9SS type A sorting domain-containing protein [Bacteroidota bacterium]
MVIDPFIGQNNSPVSFAPQLAARIGSPFIDNPMTNDVEGDSISFRLITPLQDIDVEVNGYQLPNMISDPNGAAANEDGTGKPEFFFEIRTGEIIWDAPVMAGAYVITYLIEEWRVIDGSLFQLGYTIREFHVEVEEIQNNRPYLVIPADTLIQAGDTLIVIIQGFDPDGDDFNIESSGAIYNLDTIPAEYSLEGNELKFSWKTDPDHISPQAYEVVFRIYDNPGEGPILYDYKTWRIMVSNVTAHNDSRRLGQLKIYPNPSAGIFNIENNFEEQGAYNFLVYDQRLRLISSTTVQAPLKITQVNLEGYSKGLYFLKISSSGKSMVKKLLLVE